MEAFRGTVPVFFAQRVFYFLFFGFFWNLFSIFLVSKIDSIARKQPNDFKGSLSSLRWRRTSTIWNCGSTSKTWNWWRVTLHDRNFRQWHIHARFSKISKGDPRWSRVINILSLFRFRSFWFDLLKLCFQLHISCRAHSIMYSVLFCIIILIKAESCTVRHQRSFWVFGLRVWRCAYLWQHDSERLNDVSGVARCSIIGLASMHAWHFRMIHVACARTWI